MEGPSLQLNLLFDETNPSQDRSRTLGIDAQRRLFGLASFVFVVWG